MIPDFSCDFRFGTETCDQYFSLATSSTYVIFRFQIFSDLYSINLKSGNRNFKRKELQLTKLQYISPFRIDKRIGKHYHILVVFAFTGLAHFLFPSCKLL